MAFFNNHTLALDALGTSGFVVPTEQRAAMDTSLVIKKEEAGLSTLGFWGRVYTLTGKDYLVAQGCNGIQTSDDRINVDVKCYYSLDGAKWLDLQPLTDDAYDICKTIQGGFKGDPSQRYKALVRVPPPPPTPPAPPSKNSALAFAFASSTRKAAAPIEGENPDAPKVEEVEKPAEAEVTTDNPEGQEEEEEGEEGEEGAKKKKKKKDPNMKTVEFGELDRLSALIRAVDEECGVMPVNALVLNARKQLVPNTLFSGVKFPEKLDSYGHLYQRYEDTLLSKDITGSWSVQMTPITGDVILRSLWWPGYSFYYNASTKAYGSLYFGMGDKNLDFAFMVG
ncbi:radial spoke head protein 9 homolog [Selaginella moellendorffii]|uniref:radial spoke head protein 9 homolog n=1 Tax=Selaginella moellendorffii TaxID=88036 RepID=UPI000D1C929B|nr:radial spoke head protein 9 homolog [Selaginella moellendorffii]|eukprot:XP_024517109.1 radial spoke head protein 9 homolog [Selaginella moellendorffii]